MSEKSYASLVGPLIQLYYPLLDFSEDPITNELAQRLALNSSKLAKLWCAIYPESKVDEMLEEYGGQKLPPVYAGRLDYDYHEVMSFVDSRRF